MTSSGQTAPPHTQFYTGREELGSSGGRWQAPLRAGCVGTCRGPRGASDRAVLGCVPGWSCRVAQIGNVIWEQWNNGTVVLDLNPTRGAKTPGDWPEWPQQTTRQFVCSSSMHSRASQSVCVNCIPRIVLGGGDAEMNKARSHPQEGQR